LRTQHISTKLSATIGTHTPKTTTTTMTMRLLEHVPSSFLVGQGFCLDDQGSATYARFYCRGGCPSSISPQACASSCWDIQERHLNHFKEDIITPGYVWSPDSCDCLIDPNGAGKNELYDVGQQTDFAFRWETTDALGPITNSTGDDNYRSCYAFDVDTYNQTETTSDETGVPPWLVIGQGRCSDDWGATDYTGVFCWDCQASLSQEACSSSCWGIQQTYIEPLERNFQTLGFLLGDDYCECLLDTNGVGYYDFPFDEFNGIEAQTNFSYYFGGTMDMGPITGFSPGSSSHSWCFAFEIDTDQPETCEDYADFIDSAGDGCDWYVDANRCNDCLLYMKNGRTACGNCCKCGGGWRGGVIGEDNQPPNDNDPNYTEDDESGDFSTGATFGIFFVVIIFVCTLAFFLQNDKARRRAQSVSAQGQSPQPSAHTSAPTEDELLSDFEARLAATSMIVSKKDLIPKEPTLRKISLCGDDGADDQDSGDTTTFASAGTSKGEEEEIVVPPMQDIELGTDEEDCNFSPIGNIGVESMRSDAEHNWVLQLPCTTDSQPPPKQVSCVCAICLSAYKVEETVSWAAEETRNRSNSSSSTLRRCPHAFHTSCIVKYAMTSTESGTNTTTGVVPCPLCRQPFVGTSNS